MHTNKFDGGRLTDGGTIGEVSPYAPSTMS